MITKIVCVFVLLVTVVSSYAVTPEQLKLVTDEWQTRLPANANPQSIAENLCQDWSSTVVCNTIPKSLPVVLESFYNSAAKYVENSNAATLNKVERDFKALAQLVDETKSTEHQKRLFLGASILMAPAAQSDPQRFVKMVATFAPLVMNRDQKYLELTKSNQTVETLPGDMATYALAYFSLAIAGIPTINWYSSHWDIQNLGYFQLWAPVVAAFPAGLVAYLRHQYAQSKALKRKTQADPNLGRGFGSTLESVQVVCSQVL